MEVIILKITNYKEKDGIIEAINEEQTMSFLVRGLFDPKSKNAYLNNPLTIADVDFSDGKYKYPVLKSSLLIKSPINPHADLKYMSIIMMITEVSNFLLSEEEKPQIFEYLKKTIASLKDGVNPYKIAISYLANVLKISGYDFEVGGCINCGSKNKIVTFSFEEGGFICANCDNGTIKLFNKNQMLAIRESFLTNCGYIEQEIGDEELVFVLRKFFEFIHDSYGYKMKSIDLI